MYASSTRPDRTESSKKLRMPNLGGRSFPVRDRPPSVGEESARELVEDCGLDKRTNETLKIIAVRQKRVHVRLHNSLIQLVISKTSADPESAW